MRENTVFHAMRKAGFVALVVILSAATGRADDERKTKAPNFRSTDLNGDKVELEKLLGKGPILVDFWATWCKPCIKELPYIQRIHDEYTEKGLTVLAVTIDSPRSQSRVRPFIKGRKFTFPVVMDGDQSVFRLMQGQGTIPYVVVLDPEGYIRYRHTGYRPGDEIELENIVLELLEEAGIDVGEPADEEGASGDGGNDEPDEAAGASTAAPGEPSG